MINRNSLPAAIATFVVCAVFAVGSANAESLSIEAVLAKATITPPSKVEFREVRHNRMLREDMVITGYLEYQEAGSLRKVIETPFQEEYLVRPDRIEVVQNGVTKTLPLRKSRTLQTMLGGIESILAGETEQLASVFEYELSGDEQGWSLQLVPRSKRIAKRMNSLTVSGDSESIMVIRFDLEDGEWHNMEILRASDSTL